MNHKILTVAIFVGLFTLSCSGSSENPVNPDPDVNTSIISGHSIQYESSDTYLWGLWDVFIDPLTGEIDVVPFRGIAFACNVVGFVDGPPSNLILQTRSPASHLPGSIK